MEQSDTLSNYDLSEIIALQSCRICTETAEDLQSSHLTHLSTGLKMLHEGWNMAPDEGQEELEEVSQEIKKAEEEVSRRNGAGFWKILWRLMSGGSGVGTGGLLH